ncbi:uncharacterized protein CELE_F22H10.11 [Caenorhabditis elegans]|uniref:Uncharacterized protein n=1 Tax=Caenorhabditis elegans TaxID=6239 RepID=A0A0K3AT95_CAEEL|nr:Uncharacterized protein CELE_F22H10.11 [Caenorhabditis elegans]CTQ87051.1 Uncharacterized protein CELE_F22H10.11 [Caenorhabditis elegans]|eukprot:NP_001300340.1 Uncharacterized protein CELE_F22H10.11 [Caenorhabditis elegans]
MITAETQYHKDHRPESQSRHGSTLRSSPTTALQLIHLCTVPNAPYAFDP